MANYTIVKDLVLEAGVPSGGTVVENVSINPYSSVGYFNDELLTYSELTSDIAKGDGHVDGDAITIHTDITPEFNDYSYSTTEEELNKIIKFKNIVESILTITYAFTEIIIDSAVNGIDVSGDATGFEIRSKHIAGATKFEKYQNVLKLINERYITLKRQRLQWNYDYLLLNSAIESDYNFFIFPPMTIS